MALLVSSYHSEFSLVLDVLVYICEVFFVIYGFSLFSFSLCVFGFSFGFVSDFFVGIQDG